jgi:mannobiose 2-epimerase
MPESERLKVWRDQIETELTQNIIPFWQKHTVDHQYGGFHGRISNDLEVDPDADKGLILNTRVLWTFSRLHGTYPDGNYRLLADRAFAYLDRYFCLA